jgi:hypothetical protein
MNNNFEKKRIPGMIMVIVGFILILISALNYILHWKMGSPPAAIGIIFVAVGMGWVRKPKKGNIREPE